MDESDGELEDRSRPHPIDESHRVTLRFDTEKHINPRTGEVIEGVKHTEKNPLSYDVQNIEPVAPSNVARRYGIKEDASLHSSTKDSAYGSLDVPSQQKSTSNRPDTKQVSLERASDVSPSRSLAGSSIHQTVTPLSSHVQRFQRTEEVFTKELENQRGSTSTLHSMGNSSRSNSLRVTRNSSLDSASNVTNDNNNSPLENDVSGASSRPNNPVITQNGFSPGTKQTSAITQPYVSMKNTVYETVATRTDLNQSKDENNMKNSPDSPYTSMMNIVQGQIKISPLANETDKNIVNVSVTSVNRKKVQ